MIVCKGDREGKPFTLFAISFDDMEKMKDGQHVIVTAESHPGLVPPGEELVFLATVSDEEMVATLNSNGVVLDDAKIIPSDPAI